MDITTVNLDQGQATPEFTRNQSRVKFEMVNYPYEPPKKKGSFLGKIFKTLGAFSPIGLFLGPPGWIAGGAAAALGQIGAMSDAKASQPDPRPASYPLSYPGLSTMSMSGYDGNFIPPATLASDPTLDLVAASRDNAISSAIHR